MSDYRFFMINKADHIVDGHVAACLSDDEAMAVAPQYLTGYAAVNTLPDTRPSRYGSRGAGSHGLRPCLRMASASRGRNPLFQPRRKPRGAGTFACLVGGPKRSRR
jgi:hypothetical protein